MKNEIKVNKSNKSITFINNGIAFSQFGVADEILDLITNLQEELDYQRQAEIEYNEKHTKLMNKYKNLQEENERLKEKLNCKEYFSSTMPKNTEFVILTKQNYDRQQKDIELELIDYKSRNEKAIEYINDLRSESAERQGFYNCFPDDLHIADIDELLDILKGENNDV